MALALDDPIWDSIKDCYGDSVEVRQWLKDAYSSNSITDDRLGEIVNAIQHQGDTSSAMYAVAPHMIELSKLVGEPMQLALLTHAGVVYAFAKRDGYADCLDEIEAGFRDAAADGARFLSILLPEAATFEEFQWGVAALSGFLGYDKLARLLGNLDLYEGEFHYSLLDHKIPVDP